LDFEHNEVFCVMAATYDIPPKRYKDPNQLVKSIIDMATGQKPDSDPTPEEQGKDLAPVSLGRPAGRV
jgi:hypothetical protein